MSETTTTTAQAGTRKSRTTAPAPRIAIVDLTPNNVGTLRKLNSVLFPVSYSDKFYHQVLEDYLSDYCKLIYYNDLPVGAVCCRIEPDPKEPSAGSTGKVNGSTNTQSNQTKLYIMTLGVLAPYRQQGLATKLLHQVISAAQQTHLAAQSTSHHANGEGPTPTPASTTTQPESKKTSQKGKKATVAKPVESSESKPNPSHEDADEHPVKIPAISSAYVHVQFGNEDAKEFYLKRGFRVDGEVAEYYRKIEPRGAWILVKEVTSP
ncbi:hypothetical protein PTTG_12592 [Puccinia triticina 1-1 BBBD Race 1]|uniref:N-acetyltransferase domain-containing protein n=2 Tax=Puccinia triticina TaxID=208348 RepID=A0A180GMQ8_PUCT1|nr:uncharacterized protein PtA15_2A798 [Puccinia triticina]OAV93955.1 hypothetical protein PTTG_12592 [Puccinia triticina 1-1 BBBD Race 1]WAQ82481.1 hypothetical protein PtA15_2A798 [Puccinia triticina]WAR53333.1 hypothetical protein PtB15_2B764 [Puccinia triticina]